MSSDGSHSLECDLVVGKIDMLDLGSPTSLTGPLVAFFVALPLDAKSFVFDARTCVGRLCFDVGTFQVSDLGLGMR